MSIEQRNGYVPGLSKFNSIVVVLPSGTIFLILKSGKTMSRAQPAVSSARTFKRNGIPDFAWITFGVYRD